MHILDIDPTTLIIQVGGFILLLLVFKLFLFKAVLAVLDARRNEVAQTYEDAETKVKSAEALKADYEARLLAVEDEIRGKLSGAVKEGQKMKEEILADSREQAEKILSKGQDEVQREKQKAFVELKTTVADLAVKAAGKVIEENLDVQKHQQMITSFIDQLDGVSK